MPTPEQIAGLDSDIAFIGTVATGPASPGTATNREGAVVKTVARSISEMAAPAYTLFSQLPAISAGTAGYYQVLPEDTGTHASVAGDVGASAGQTPNTGFFRGVVGTGYVRIGASQAGRAETAAASAVNSANEAKQVILADNSYGVPEGEAIANGGAVQSAAATFRFQNPVKYDFVGKTLDIFNAGAAGLQVRLRMFDASGAQAAVGPGYSGEKLLTLEAGANIGLPISDFFGSAGMYWGLYAQIGVLTADATKRSTLGGYWTASGNATTGVVNLSQVGIRHDFRINVTEKGVRGDEYADSLKDAPVAASTSYGSQIEHIWDGSSLFAGNHGENPPAVLVADYYSLPRSGVRNVAVGGRTVAQMIAAAPTELFPQIDAALATNRIVIVHIDSGVIYNTVNNNAAASAATATADIAAAFSSLVSAITSWKAAYPNGVVFDLWDLPNVNGTNKWVPEHYAAFQPAFEATAVGGVVDYVTRISSIPETQVNTNLAYWQADRVHPMTALNILYTPVAAEALNAYLWTSYFGKASESEGGETDTPGSAITTPTVKPTWAAGDSGGQDVIQVMPDGSINNRHIQSIDNDVATMRAFAATNRVRRAKLLAGINHVAVYGQSNAVASHGTTQTPGGSTAAGAIITTDVPNALTFNAGELTTPGSVTDPATQMASLVTLNNTIGGSRENWGASCALMIAQLLNTEDGITATNLSHRWLFSSMGLSATAIEQLMLGTPSFARVMRDLQYGSARAADQAGAMQVYQPRNLLMVEGESDYQGDVTPFEKYISKSQKMTRDVSYFSKLNSGRIDDVLQWVVQVSSHVAYASVADPVIAKAQLEMERRGICMPIIPGYGALTRYGTANVYGMDTDQVHYIAPGIIKLAATLGFMMKRYWYDGVVEKGCRIINHDRQGLWTLLEFSGYGPLVLDTTSLPTWANSGITAADAAGAAVTVSSVDLVDAPHRILAVKTATLASTLRFGWAGATTTGRTGSGGTNIRDSLRDVLTFTRPDAVQVPIDNHLPIMELTL